MLPFCGYNMGSYFAHWLTMGKRSTSALLPRIYAVNWFGKGKENEWLWPGFGENSRVLKWIFERTSGKDNGIETPIGILPKEGAIDTEGLQLAPDAMKQLLAVDRSEWLQEAEEISRYFTLFGRQLPPEMADEIEKLKLRFLK